MDSQVVRVVGMLIVVEEVQLTVVMLARLFVSPAREHIGLELRAHAKAEHCMVTDRGGSVGA